MVYNVPIFAIFTNVKKSFLFLQVGGGDGIVDVVEERESISRCFFLVGEKSFLVKLKVKHFEDVPLVELCTLYLHACQVSYRRWLRVFAVVLALHILSTD